MFRHCSNRLAPCRCVCSQDAAPHAAGSGAVAVKHQRRQVDQSGCCSHAVMPPVLLPNHFKVDWRDLEGLPSTFPMGYK